MTGDGKGPPKYARAAAAVRVQIADGTLRPGQPAPSGAALSRLTGFSTLTCRRALRLLIADGVLVAGPSRNARPRVAGAPQPPAQRDLGAAVRGLSAGLAARRRAAGLTQPELAALTGNSVTTVGHAETGRLWQSRRFWERADAVLGAEGELLRLHDAYRAAGAGTAGDTGSAGPSAPPFGGGATHRDPIPPPSAPVPDIPPPRAQAAALWLGPGLAGDSDAGPACVMIVWGDGTVTTVRPPGQDAPPDPSAGRAV
jgi:hypothetical protein